MIKEDEMLLSDEEWERIGKNKEIYIEYLKRTEREGMNDLIDWLEHKSDFFWAPASTRFHGNYGGGLCEHSLHVLDRLRYHMADKIFKDRITNWGMNTAIIAALLHDICKANMYTIELRNRKIDGVWRSVPCFAVEDVYPYGHGEKSVDIIRNYITLTDEEKFAIRWHMGYTEPKEEWVYLDEAITRYPLVLALHEADLEASKFLDRTVEKR